MSRLVRSTVATAVLALVLTGAAAGPAGAARPIGPDQHFMGLVNGTHNRAVVEVVCPGPVGSGEVGGVVGGQTVSARRVGGGHGDTGLFSHLYAWFVPAGSSPAPTQLTIGAYRTAVPIPTSVAVPCGGPGQVEFSSCPYGAPCAAGWTPYVVEVTFEDIAV